MLSTTLAKLSMTLVLGAGLTLVVPAAAAAPNAPTSCGDKKKDVKKPTDDDKKPANPASADALCGGNKKKDVKKPTDDDEKPANPASADALCGGNKKKDVKKPTDDDKKPANPA